MAPDPARRAAVLRLAAQYVERKAKGESVTWAPTARVSRLDAEGNPTGPSVHVGPLIVSGEAYSPTQVAAQVATGGHCVPPGAPPCTKVCCAPQAAD